MVKTIALITALTITPVNPREPEPVETITITKALAEQLVQTIKAQQVGIEQLKMEIYQYQQLLHDARVRMCA